MSSFLSGVDLLESRVKLLEEKLQRRDSRLQSGTPWFLGFEMICACFFFIFLFFWGSFLLGKQLDAWSLPKSTGGFLEPEKTDTQTIESLRVEACKQIGPTDRFPS